MVLCSYLLNAQERGYGKDKTGWTGRKILGTEFTLCFLNGVIFSISKRTSDVVDKDLKIVKEVDKIRNPLQILDFVLHKLQEWTK